MGKPYKNEVKNLSLTYEWARKVNITDIAKTIDASSDLPLISVGSGGSFSVAELQTSLHHAFFGTMGQALTPMQLAYSIPFDGKVSLWFVTASGNNIDILRSFQHAAVNEIKMLSAIVGREKSKIAILGKKFEYANVFERKLPIGKDGFLATNSLLGFSIILARSYFAVADRELILPETIDELISECLPKYKNFESLKKEMRNIWKSDVIHVIYSPSLKSAAADIESKFIEAGLGSVHLADIRNFAHGRHHWFAKNKTKQGILCLTTANDRILGEKTLQYLPPSIAKTNITVEGGVGLSQIIGLLLSIQFAGWKGDIRKIDPGRPGVPEYGSKIYHLKSPSGFSTSNSIQNIAILRKRRSSPDFSTKNSTWSDSYRNSISKFQDVKFGAVVFDYDGTLIDSRNRDIAPSREIIAAIARLLESGIILGIATGRGKSIRKSLIETKVFGEAHWNKIIVGYYNGAKICNLSENLEQIDSEKMPENLTDLIECLRADLESKLDGVKITERSNQVTIELIKPSCKPIVLNLLQERLTNIDRSKIKIVQSRHSIDILTVNVSKLSVVKKIEDQLPLGLKVLSIGDQGKWPGNDFELLSHEFSLSVDEVSSRDDRCWNLCPAGIVGPQGTLAYLNDFVIEKGSFQYRLRGP